MKLIAKRCFLMQRKLLTDSRAKLHIEAVQELRIQYRWEVIDLENEIIKQAKDKTRSSIFLYLENHDTRNSYWQEVGIYFTNAGKMDGKPKNIRAKILFDEYPDLEKSFTTYPTN